MRYLAWVLFWAALTYIVLASVACSSLPTIDAPPGVASTKYAAPVHQCDFPIVFATSMNLPVDLTELVTKAAQYWNTFAGVELFLGLGSTPLYPGDLRGHGFVVFGLPSPTYSIGHTSALAETSVMIQPHSGCIVRAWVNILKDIQLEPEYLQESALRHEFGHVLGLAHIEGTGLMSPRLKGINQETPIELSIEEQAAFHFLYDTKD